MPREAAVWFYTCNATANVLGIHREEVRRLASRGALFHLRLDSPPEVKARVRRFIPQDYIDGLSADLVGVIPGKKSCVIEKILRDYYAKNERLCQRTETWLQGELNKNTRERNGVKYLSKHGLANTLGVERRWVTRERGYLLSKIDGLVYPVVTLATFHEYIRWIRPS